MIKRLIWTPMSSVLKKADKLNLSLSLSRLINIKKRQLHDKTRNIQVLVFGVTYIRGLMVGTVL